MALVRCCIGFLGFFTRPPMACCSDFMDFFIRPRTILAWDRADPEESVQNVPTLYDETHAGIWHKKLQTPYTGHGADLIAHLEHPAPNTDGHFDVIIAEGDGSFISQNFYNSIPEEHRPQMKGKAQEVTFINDVKANTLGQVFVPILLTNANNGKGFRIVLHAYVMEAKTWMGLFISHPSWIKRTLYKKGGWEHVCDFWKGNAGRRKGKVVLKELRRWQSTAETASDW